MEQAITYQELRLSLFDILSVEQLLIEEGANCHGTMTLTALLAGNWKEEAVHEMGEQVILFYQDEEKMVPLFQGLLKNLKLFCQGDVYKVTVEAKSSTYKMDLQKRNRSFQDRAMKSHRVIEHIMKSYPGSGYLLSIPNQPINSLALQYEETDWEFLKRFVSRYQKLLYVENRYPGIRFYGGDLGITAPVFWGNRPFQMQKNLEAWKKAKSRGFPDALDSDYITCTIKAYDYLPLGVEVVFQNQHWILSQAKRILEDGLLTSVYQMSFPRGLRTERKKNPNLPGISLDGFVRSVYRDQVQVAFPFDISQRQRAGQWFPFSTVAATKGGHGWYSMPSVGESIRVYFPSDREEEGYAVAKALAHMPGEKEDRSVSTLSSQESLSVGQSSKRVSPVKKNITPVIQRAPSPSLPPSPALSVPENPSVKKEESKKELLKPLEDEAFDPMGDPKVKNITTPSGQQILFEESSVTIQVNGGKGNVVLSQDGSVSFTGMEQISLQAGLEIKLRSETEMFLQGNLLADASSEQKGTVKIMPGGTLELGGKEIKSN